MSLIVQPTGCPQCGASGKTRMLICVGNLLKTTLIPFWYTFFLVLSIAGQGLGAADPEVPSSRPATAPAPRKPIFAPIQDEPGLPRVLLIGDSISNGYTMPTRELLRGKANVHRIPTNGGPTTRGLDNLDAWLGDGKWDVIHFNWGLHDLAFMKSGKHQVPIEEYEKNLRKLVARLRKTGARLIWASTTPVPQGRLDPPRKNADVQAYNAVAARIMKENGIPTDDLYSFALPRLSEMQYRENVHFKPEGSQLFAERVAASILEALRKPSAKPSTSTASRPR